MTELHDELPPIEELVGAGAPGAGDDSLFQQLQQARKESAENRETFIAIPGYEKSGIEILARYRLVDGPELEEISRKIQVGKGRGRGFWTKNLNTALDVMARACTGIFIQRTEDDEPLPLTVNGQPILNYGDPNLKIALGIDDRADTVRKVIIAAFCDNDLAVSSHSIKLNRWFQNTNVDVDNDFLGEA